MQGAALGRRKESSHSQSEMSRNGVRFVILRFDDHSGMLSTRMSEFGPQRTGLEVVSTHILNDEMCGYRWEGRLEVRTLVQSGLRGLTSQKVGEEAGGKTGGWPTTDGIFKGNGSLEMGGPLVNSGAVVVIVCVFTLS